MCTFVQYLDHVFLLFLNLIISVAFTFLTVPVGHHIIFYAGFNLKSLIKFPSYFLIANHNIREMCVRKYTIFLLGQHVHPLSTNPLCFLFALATPLLPAIAWKSLTRRYVPQVHTEYISAHAE